MNASQQYQDFLQHYQKSLQQQQHQPQPNHHPGNFQMFLSRFSNPNQQYPNINPHQQNVHIEQLKKHFNLQYSNYIQSLQKQQQQQKQQLQPLIEPSKATNTLKRTNSCNSIILNEDIETSSNLVEDISEIDEDLDDDETFTNCSDETNNLNSSKIADTKLTPEKYNFTLKALEFSLYGYFKQNENSSHAVSGLKVFSSQNDKDEFNLTSSTNKRMSLFFILLQEINPLRYV